MTFLPLLTRLESGVPPSPFCFSGNQEMLNYFKGLCVKLRFYIHLRVLCVESWFSKAGNSFLLTLLFPWTRLPSSTKRSGDECKIFNLFVSFMKVRLKVRVFFFKTESTRDECKIFYFSETLKVMLARLGLHLIGDFSRGSVASVKTGFPNTSTCLEPPISELVLNLKTLIN